MTIHIVTIPQKCSISSVLVFSRLKIYRAPSELPRLYRLKQAKLKYDPVLKQRIFETDSLLLDFAGEANSKRAYDAVACNTHDRDWVSALYEKYAEIDKDTKEKEPFKSWWARIYYEWTMFGDSLIDEAPLAFTTDPNTYTMGFADLSQVCQGPHPAWDNFMSQMNDVDQKIVMAFFWSIFEIENRGRQILYLYDRGLTGKSDVSNTFFSMLPHASGSISESSFKTNFGYSTIYGNRLLIYPDCKVKDILIDEKLCSISGGDNVLIEYKGLGAYTGSVYAKVIIMSNQAPSIDTYRLHETSRLIPIRLDPDRCKSKEHFDAEGNFVGNNKFITQLKEEFWHFLYDCKQIYPSMCPTNREIILRSKDRSETVYEDIKSDYEQIFDSWMQEDFELAADKKIYGYELFIFLRDDLLNKENPRTRAIFLKEFKIYLSEKYNINPVYEDFYHEKRRIRRYVYIGINKKDHAEYSKFQEQATDEDMSSLFKKSSGETGMEAQGLEGINVEGI